MSAGPGPAAVVAAGRVTVRVARAGPDGAVRVAEAAAGPPLPGLLVGLVEDGTPVVELGDPAVAVAGDVDAVVLDAGRSRSDVALVRRGVVVRRRRGPGGADLDAAVAALLVRRRPAWAGHPALPAEAERVRETLSLLPGGDAALPGAGAVPVTAAEVRAALAEPLRVLARTAAELAGPGGLPVLVVGGVARTPLLAELLDAAGLPDVRVLPRPDVAALLAACGRARPLPAPADRPAPARSRLPPPARRGRLRVVAAVLAAAALLGGLHVVGGLVAGPATGGPVSGPSGVLAQYDYRLRLPAGWAHTGGLPERRRTLLTPLTAPEGSDLIAVESTPLGYDAAAEPARAAAELRALYDGAVAAGTALSGYDASAEFAGRAVTAYREDDGDTAVRWFVLLDGPAQRSVGCRHTPAGEAPVVAACAEVVASLGPA